MTPDQLNALVEFMREIGREPDTTAVTVHQAFGFRTNSNGDATDEPDESRPPPWEVTDHPTIGYKFSVCRKGTREYHERFDGYISGFKDLKNAKKKAKELNAYDGY